MLVGLGGVGGELGRAFGQAIVASNLKNLLFNSAFRELAISLILATTLSIVLDSNYAAVE